MTKHLRGPGWGLDRAAGPRRGRWSQAELARLRELYGLRDDRTIARELGRPLASVRKMAETIFAAQEPKSGPWSADEVEALKRYLGLNDVPTISRILGRSIQQIEQQLFELGRIQSSGKWSAEEIGEFKKLYGTRTDEDLALIFGRSVKDIRERAKRYCLAKDKAFLRKISGESATRMPRWADDEIKQLEKLYPDHSNLEIAKILDRSVKSVVSKAHNLGLKKDDDRLKAMGRENVSRRYRRSRKDGEGA